MSEPFLSEIKLFAFGQVPKGWALCNGQLLPINQNQALFSLLGTIYGGNGQTTFALPDLRGRIPIHLGAGFTQGQRGGEEAHTLTTAELPPHGHATTGSSNAPILLSPANALWATQTAESYSSNPDTTMHPSAVGPVGGSQPHENRAPYLVLTYGIALQGIFPTRN